MLKVLIPLVTLLAGASDKDAIQRMEEANQAVATTMKQQLVEVAEQRGVELRAESVTYVTVGSTFVVHGPPVGADKYSEEQFAEGVNVAVLYVGGGAERLVPRGFYVVRAVLPVGAEEGKAEFLGASGEVVATAPLFVRTREQELAFLPPLGGPDPVAIPNITSTHVTKYDQYGNPIPGVYVDCMYVEGTRTLYFPM